MLENNLTRDTPFVANIKFRNTLPELPCDPKMLSRLHDTEALSRFHLTNAEENLRPELAMAQDPSVLSAMHLQKYCYSESPGELHPDDRALIEGQVNARAHRGNVAWLMKTRCGSSPFRSIVQHHAIICVTSKPGYDQQRKGTVPLTVCTTSVSIGV